MQNAIININGEILTHTEHAKISVFDRGYLYGDSIYEVVRSYQGKFFLLDDHLKRLENSARLCHMTLSQSPAHFKQEIYRTFAAFQNQPENRGHENKGLEKGQEKVKDAYARIMVSRGIGKLGFSQSSVTSPTQYVILLLPVTVPSHRTYHQGVKAQVAARIRNDRRALDPAMKSGNYLNSVLAFLEAEADGFDDALLCNADGHITEGTTFNVFYLRRGIAVTPPLDIGILDGVTRRLVLKVLEQLEIPLREVRFPKERLYEADEIFLTSSIKEVLSISQIDQHKVGKGTVGPLTLKIHQAYQKAAGEFDYATNTTPFKK